MEIILMSKYILVVLIVLLPVVAMAEGNDDSMRIKDGAEVRCLSGLVDEEFMEDDYAGEYFFGSGNCVSIENDIAHSGHLILHAECLNLHRPLYRFNKYIYVYGESPDSPEPVLGSVTFLSDGSHVNQLILQHDSKQSYFPMKK